MGGRKPPHCAGDAGSASSSSIATGDMFEKGIIDPAKVVRIALQDAASIAGLMITTEAGVAEATKKEASGHAESHGGMGGMM